MRAGVMVFVLAAVLTHGAEVPALSVAPGNLEGEWRFATDPQEAGERLGWQQPGFDDSSWRLLRVPGSWEPQGVTEPRPGRPAQPKGDLPWTDYDGVAWYRRTVVVPAAWQGEPLVLILGRVDDEDRAFVNGTLVGETGPGLARAVLQARRYVLPAACVRPGRPNTIALRVKDSGGPGGIDGPVVSLLPQKEMTVNPLPAEDRPFAERFQDPPGSVRILKIMHGWPPAAESAIEAVEALRQQGFGGLATNVAFGDDYLRNPAAWDLLRRVLTRARELRMAAWLYDEKGYPSGTAGGQVVAGHPEWEPEGLLVVSSVATGAVELKLPPGALRLAAAYPAGRAPDAGAAVPLADRIADGVLRWTPPAGRWQVVIITQDRIYEGTHAAHNVYRHQPYANLLLPEPTREFIRLTHEAYARELGDNLGAVFQATFTDEPSLMSAFLSPMPYAVLPWSANLPAEFARRRGYALEPELAALVVAETARARQVRYDFWLTVAELVSAGFCEPIRDWCRAHGLPAGGHLLWEEGLRMHVPFYGDFFACLRGLDAPGIDCLTSLPPQVPWSVARLASSVAELEGRTLTMSETSDHSQRYRPVGDTRPVQQVTLNEIRGTVDRLVVGGINTITSYYSFAGLSREELVGLNEYVGRCCTALRGGYQVADVAVVYPVQSLWPHYDPSPHLATRDPVAARIEQAYNGALDALFAAGRDATIVDARALAAATVEGAELVHGRLRWKVLVLPGVETLPAAAWERVAAFHRAGGIVVALAQRPANTEQAFPAPAVAAWVREWFGDDDGPVCRVAPGGGTGVFLPAGMEALLPVVVDRLVERDVAWTDPAPLRTTHRRVDEHDVYFVINDSPAAFRGRVTVAATGAGEQWDPRTGTSVRLAGPEADLALEPYTGVILRWPAARDRRRTTPAADAALGLVYAPDPTGFQAGIGAGEHVAAEPVADATLADGRPAWRTVGTVRTTNVDTFLFLALRREAPLDASGTDFVALDIEVPAGQTAPAAAHLIVAEADGGEFIAPLGFALNDPGLHRVWVPWDGLKPVGWKKGGDGILDRARVTAFSIGWGGYFGQDGERLELRIGAPRCGRLAR